LFLEGMGESQNTQRSKLGDIKADSLTLGVPASYGGNLNNYDQVNTAKRSDKRLLVTDGDLDFQVAIADSNMWKSGRTNKDNVQFKQYPDLNHLFVPQKEKGTVNQYRFPGNVSGAYIDDLAQWIKM